MTDPVSKKTHTCRPNPVRAVPVTETNWPAHTMKKSRIPVGVVGEVGSVWGGEVTRRR